MGEDELLSFTGAFDGSDIVLGVQRMATEVSELVDQVQAKFDTLSAKSFSPKSVSAGYLGTATKGIDNLASSSETLLGHLDRMSGHFTSGLGIGVAVGGMALLTGAFDRGIQKAREFQTAQISIAATLTSVGTRIGADGKTLSRPDQFAANLQYAKALQQQLLDASTKNHLKFEEQVGAFQSSIASGARKGMNIDQIFQISDLGAMAAKSLNLHGEQIANATRLLTGGGVNVGRSTIGRALGITNQDITSRSGNDLYKFLEDKLKGFQAAQNEFGNSIEGVISTIESKVDTLMARVGMRFFNAVRPTIARFLDVFDDPKQGQGANSGSNGINDPNESDVHFQARVAQHKKDAEALNHLTDAAADMFTKIFKALASVIESGQFQTFVSLLETLAGYADKLVLGAVFAVITSNILKAQRGLATFATTLKSMGGAQSMEQVIGGLANGGLKAGKALTAEQMAVQMGWAPVAAGGALLGGGALAKKTISDEGVTLLAGKLDKQIAQEENAVRGMHERSGPNGAAGFGEFTGHKKISDQILAEGIAPSDQYIDLSTLPPMIGPDEDVIEGETENHRRSRRELTNRPRRAALDVNLQEAFRQDDMNSAIMQNIANSPYASRNTPEYDDYRNASLGAYADKTRAEQATRGQALVEELRLKREALNESYNSLFSAGNGEETGPYNEEDALGRNRPAQPYEHAYRGSFDQAEREAAEFDRDKSLWGRTKLLGQTASNYAGSALGGAIGQVGDKLMSSAMITMTGMAINDYADNNKTPGVNIGGTPFDIGHVAGDATEGYGVGALGGPAIGAITALTNVIMGPFVRALNTASATAKTAAENLETYNAAHPNEARINLLEQRIINWKAEDKGTPGKADVPGHYEYAASDMGGHVIGMWIPNAPGTKAIAPGVHKHQEEAAQKEINSIWNKAGSKYTTNYNPENDAIARLQAQIKAEGTDANFTYDQRAKRARETETLNDLLIGQQYKGYKSAGPDGNMHYDDQTAPGWMAANHRVTQEAANKNSALYQNILRRQASEHVDFGTARSEQEQAAIDNIMSPQIGKLEAADKQANDTHAEVEERSDLYTSLGLKAGNQHNDIGQKFYEALNKATEDAGKVFQNIDTGSGKQFIQNAVNDYFKYGIAEPLRDLQEKQMAVPEAEIALDKAAYAKTKLPEERRKMVLDIAGDRLSSAQVNRQIAHMPREINDTWSEERQRQRTFNREQEDEPEKLQRDQMGIDNADYQQQDFFAGMNGGVGKIAADIRKSVDLQYAGKFNPVAYREAYTRKVQNEIENLDLDKMDAVKKLDRDKEDNTERIAKFKLGFADFLDKLTDLRAKGYSLILEKQKSSLTTSDAQEALKFWDKTSGTIATDDIMKAQIGVARAKDALALAQRNNPSAGLAATESAARASGYTVPAFGAMPTGREINALGTGYAPAVHRALSAQTDATRALHNKINSKYSQGNTSKNSQQHGASSTPSVTVPLTVMENLDPKAIQLVAEKAIRDYCQQQSRRAVSK
jgi:hypothetical protein